MKKTLSLVISLILVISCCAVFASAAETGATLVSTETEYLENGSYIVSEIYQEPALTRSSSTSGYKTSTYYTGSGSAIWAVTVHGYFSYNYGSSAWATDAYSSVDIYDSRCSLQNRDAYYYDNHAAAIATVRFISENTVHSVTLSCDSYGNLY